MSNSVKNLTGLRRLSSFFYALFQIGQGLLLHPHKTMQSLVRQPAFGWLVFLPMFFLVLGKVVWYWGVAPLGRWLLSPSFGSGLLSTFFINWISYFFWAWQILILYLLIRFFWAFWEKK